MPFPKPSIAKKPAVDRGSSSRAAGVAKSAAEPDRELVAGECSYEEVVQQAAEEGLVLVAHNNTTGFKGVTLSHCSLRSPYQAHSRLKGRKIHLGVFASPWEAALCYARHVGPEQARREAAEATAAGLSTDDAAKRAEVSPEPSPAVSAAVTRREPHLRTPPFKSARGMSDLDGIDGEATKAALSLQFLGNQFREHWGSPSLPFEDERSTAGAWMTPNLKPALSNEGVA